MRLKIREFISWQTIAKINDKADSRWLWRDGINVVCIFYIQGNVLHGLVQFRYHIYSTSSLSLYENEKKFFELGRHTVDTDSVSKFDSGRG
ncbi:MAG: hypothetical protein Kow0065_02260 [Methylomicrobium sp.]